MTCEYFEDPKGEVGLRSPTNLRSCGLESGVEEFYSDIDLGGIKFRELTIRKDGWGFQF